MAHTPTSTNTPTSPLPGLPTDQTEMAFSSSEARFERLRCQRRLSYQHWLKAFAYDVRTLLREARGSLIGFLLVMVSGTFYFLITAPDTYDFFSALYETMTMLALEHNADFPADIFGRLLFFAIPILGLAFVFQGVIDFGRLVLDKGSRLEGWQISLARTYSNHVILCGLGRVTYRVMLELLEAGHGIVVIERDWNSEFVPAALALHVPVIQGDARATEILEQAGAGRACGLITLINDDLINIEVGLSARRIRYELERQQAEKQKKPTPHQQSRFQVVLRIFSEQLDEYLEQSKFGPETAFSSSAIAAPTLVAASVCRGIRYAVRIRDEILGISEVIVTSGSKLEVIVRKIEENFHVQVIGFSSTEPGKEPVWRRSISPSTRLHNGDRLLLFGRLDELSEVWRHGHTANEIAAALGFEAAQQATDQYDTIIVCGLGRIGYWMVRELHHLMQRMPNIQRIVVICGPKALPRFIHDVKELGAEVIQGDALDPEVLQQAGIERAYSVCGVIDDDLTNLRIGLAARQLRSDVHLVLRIFSDVLAEQLEGMFGAQTTFSPWALAAPTLAAATLVPGTPYAVDVGNQLLSVARLTIRPGDEFADKPVYQLRERYEMFVFGLWRGERFFLLPKDPKSDDALYEQPLRVGDEIAVLAEIHKIDELRKSRGASSDITTDRSIAQSLLTQLLTNHPSAEPRLTRRLTESEANEATSTR